MRKILNLCTTTIFSGIGWWAGSLLNMTCGFLGAMIGTGIGYYATNKILENFDF